MAQGFSNPILSEATEKTLDGACLALTSCNSIPSLSNAELSLEIIGTSLVLKSFVYDHLSGRERSF